MHNLGRTGVLIDELSRFQHGTFCSGVCGDHRRPQTLAKYVETELQSEPIRSQVFGAYMCYQDTVSSIYWGWLYG